MFDVNLLMVCGTAVIVVGMCLMAVMSLVRGGRKK